METKTCGDFEYILLEDGTAEITEYKGSAETLDIPAQLDGYAVASIGEDTFFNCKSLISVNIPNSVISIGANPFEGCNALQRIYVSPGHPALATINGVLFYKPEKRLVCYPCSFTAETYAIPQGIKNIGGSAFAQCESLTSVAIPNSVTSIGDWAFFDCISLPSVTIPNGVTSIGGGAFAQCESLTSVNFPDSVTNIGDEAFYRCSNLTLTVEPNSYAEQYAKENDFLYVYPEADTSWLLD